MSVIESRITHKPLTKIRVSEKQKHPEIIPKSSLKCAVGVWGFNGRIARKEVAVFSRPIK